MAMTNLEALAKLASEATPGPWKVEATGVDYDDDGDDSEVESGWIIGPKMIDRYDYETLRFTDAAYVAAASPDVVLALVRVALAAKVHLDGIGYAKGYTDRELNLGAALEAFR
jgi:hypothetical protein